MCWYIPLMLVAKHMFPAIFMETLNYITMLMFDVVFIHCSQRVDCHLESMMETHNDWLVIITNIKKVKMRWVRLCKLLKKEKLQGTMVNKYYKSVLHNWRCG